jgi:catechol 2,3-dioxygenase-like lactoylglutathione lyase family enzyme
MGVRAVSHFAIGVRDMDTVLPFYRDLLGMRVMIDTEERLFDPSNDPPTEIRRRSVRLRWVDGVDTQFLVLDQNIVPLAEGEPTKLWQIGIHHVALWVDDVEPYLARAASFGGVALSKAPAESGGLGYAEPEGGRVRSAFLADPERNIIQLDQRLSSPW